MPSPSLLEPAQALDAMRVICRAAGHLLAAHYQRPATAYPKQDGSPVTAADRAAHAQIARDLQLAFPGVPLLSEEGEAIPYATRRHWPQFFLVDPMDGTKGFLKRNGHFCVCIALVQHGRSIAGCIHSPVDDALYAGGTGLGATVQHAAAPAQPITTKKPAPGEALRVLCSTSRETPKLDAYLQNKDVATRLCLGSALKFCFLAEGEAHLFPCLYPTYEWDAAAGQAIVEGAGGTVLDLDGRPLRYNKENLLNHPFVVAA